MTRNIAAMNFPLNAISIRVNGIPRIQNAIQNTHPLTVLGVRVP